MKGEVVEFKKFHYFMAFVVVKIEEKVTIFYTLKIFYKRTHVFLKQISGDGRKIRVLIRCIK